MSASAKKILRLGIIGCGDVAQVVHINTLNQLSHLFKITYLFDVSKQSMENCAARVAGTPPKTATNVEELCSSPDVDAVLVCSPNAMHVQQAILALENDKHLFVEKPLALCQRDIEALKAAEASSKANLFVGYMRRYAPALQAAIDELQGSEILYARIRDMMGPNPFFIRQSGMFPQRYSDQPQEQRDKLQTMYSDIERQALQEEAGLALNDHNKYCLDLLGTFGSHDLSAMREVLGMPNRVLSASFKGSYWNATFDFGKFVAIYESGINEVPVFDAHVEVYTKNKIVRVDYDTPFVKGLPIWVVVRERLESPNEEEPSYQERRVRKTYYDPFTIELQHWHECILEGKKSKTTIEDAGLDVKLNQWILQAASQSGA